MLRREVVSLPLLKPQGTGISCSILQLVHLVAKGSPGDSSGDPVAKTLAYNTGCRGLIPSQGTRSHMRRLRVHFPQLKISQAAPKILHSQVNQSINQSVSILKKKQLPSLVPPLFEFWSQDCKNHLGMYDCTLVLKTGHTPQVSLSHTQWPPALQYFRVFLRNHLSDYTLLLMIFSC